MYQYLKTKPYLFPSVIGITHKQFHKLLPKFSIALRKAEQAKAYNKKRFRQPGGGRKAKYQTDAEKLLLIFFYYKAYPTFRLAEFFFQLDKRNIQLWVRFLENVLWDSLGYQLELPVVKAKHLYYVLDICPGLKEFLVDCTERNIQRPDKKLQEFYYSGKRKLHTKVDPIVNTRFRVE